nr:ComF family protein [Tissierella sp.]
MDYINSIFELIFPSDNLCFLCKEDEEKIVNSICKGCKANIDQVDKEVQLGSDFIKECYYSTVYDRFMKEIIKKFKFNHKSYLYKPLGHILIDTIYSKGLDGKVDMIAFVPSHRRKEAIRGYNQSQLLAEFVSKELDLPLSKTLVKKNHTFDQHFLDKKDRQDNLKDAFRVRNKEEVKDKSILLIDDILTSGSTMQECAKELIKNEAKAIFALALTSSRKL